MKAIILAAGRGSRMQNLTQKQPKCLVNLRGKALLDWQLEALRAAGISEIAIVTGYKRELLANRGLVEFPAPAGQKRIWFHHWLAPMTGYELDLAS